MITVVFCHSCGKENDVASNFCIYCGNKLIKDSIKCSKCGEINEIDSNFCVNCGNNLKNIDKPTREEYEQEVGKLKDHIHSNDFNLASINGKTIGNGKIDFININAEELASTSTKTKYHYNSKELFVEEVGIEYYRNQGYNAIWAENNYWWVIYALLFWDIIFMKTDTCTSVPMNHPSFEEQYSLLTTHRMMDMPHDFFKPTFYSTRKQQIDQRLKSFMKLDIVKEIEKSYKNNYGKYCRPIEDWDKFTLTELKIAAKLLRREQIISIMYMLALDFNRFRSGFPDLIVFNNSDFFFVEVKSKKDTLSKNQLDKHYYLTNTVKTNVIILSVNKSERQVENLKKKYIS